MDAQSRNQAISAAVAKYLAISCSSSVEQPIAQLAFIVRVAPSMSACASAIVWERILGI